MTPKDFQYATEAYNDKMEYALKMEKARTESGEYLAWLSGLYVQMAVGAVLGGKKAKRYPEKPLTDRSDSIEEIAKRSGKTEEELNADLLLATLQINEANARIEQVMGADKDE